MWVKRKRNHLSGLTDPKYPHVCPTLLPCLKGYTSRHHFEPLNLWKVPSVGSIPSDIGSVHYSIHSGQGYQRQGDSGQVQLCRV